MRGSLVRRTHETDAVSRQRPSARRDLEARLDARTHAPWTTVELQGKERVRAQYSCCSVCQLSFFSLFFLLSFQADRHKKEWVWVNLTASKLTLGIMKLLLLPILMTFVAVAQVFCEEIDPKEEADYWASSNQIQVSEAHSGAFWLSQLCHPYEPRIVAF